MLQNDPFNSILTSNAHLVTKEFETAQDFSIFIEKKSINRNISLMDAIIEYCDEEDIEVETVACMITNSLKTKIHAEAVSLNLISSNIGTLPI